MIRIITDGTCDINTARAKELDVDVMPLTIHFGQQDYVQNESITTKEFYEKLSRAKELPTTSQVNPFAFEKVFRQYVEAGDEVVGLFLSHHLSGTYQSAVIAKDNVASDRVRVIDSLTTTGGLGLLVEETAIMRNAGMGADAIAAAIQELVPKTRFVCAVDTLDYLKMGGRISSTTAFIGGLLGINPIVCVIDGKVESIGKARGKKACYQFLLHKCQEERGDRKALFFAHSNSPERVKECVSFFQENLPIERCYQDEMGPVVGTHVGPNCVGVAYFTS